MTLLIYLMNLAAKRQNDVRGLQESPTTQARPPARKHPPTPRLHTYTHMHTPSGSFGSAEENRWSFVMTLHTTQQANWPVGSQPWETTLVYPAGSAAYFGKCGTCSPDWTGCHTADKLRRWSEVLFPFPNKLKHVSFAALGLRGVDALCQDGSLYEFHIIVCPYRVPLVCSLLREIGSKYNLRTTEFINKLL